MSVAVLRSMSLFTAIALAAPALAAASSATDACFIGEPLGLDHFFFLDRALRGGQFASRFAEFDTGVGRRINAFRIGNGQLGGLKIGGGYGGTREGGARHEQEYRQHSAQAAAREVRSLDREIHGRSLLMTMNCPRAKSTRERKCARRAS